MNKNFQDQVLKQIAGLVKDGEQSLEFALGYSDSKSLGQFSKRGHAFFTQCQAFITFLGPAASQWMKTFRPPHPSIPAIEGAIGTLKGIALSLQQGWFLRIESVIFAEAFSDLLEQADYLLNNGYFLAAGVLGRAVLEEHLRKWCDSAGCRSARPKPTLSDHYGELYKANVINKLELKHVESMAAIGNDAAHNVPTLKLDDVVRLLRDLRQFLVNHP